MPANTATTQTNLPAITNRERAAKALELRKAGATFQTIADRLDYSSASSAHRSVKKALDRMIREPADDLREMEYERLNTILLTLWPRVQAGEYPAIDRAIRIGERIAALTGYDRVQPSSVTQTNVIVIDGQENDYISGLQKLKALSEAQLINKDDSAVVGPIIEVQES